MSLYANVCICVPDFQPKDVWSPTENNCEHYKCVKNGQILTAISFRIVCPPFQESNCKNVCGSVTELILFNDSWTRSKTFLLLWIFLFRTQFKL